MTKEKDGILVDSSVSASDCHMTYASASPTINTDSLDPQTSNLENGKINTQLVTGNLNEFTTDIGYFVKSSLSNLTITDYNNIQLLQLKNILKDYFIYHY